MNRLTGRARPRGIVAQLLSLVLPILLAVALVMGAAVVAIVLAVLVLVLALLLLARAWWLRWRHGAAPRGPFTAYARTFRAEESTEGRATIDGEYHVVDDERKKRGD